MRAHIFHLVHTTFYSVLYRIDIGDNILYAFAAAAAVVVPVTAAAARRRLEETNTLLRLFAYASAVVFGRLH